jgi:hypothetical protein
LMYRIRCEYISNDCLQIGVWSHQALLCRDFIHENCDKLVAARRPGPNAHVRGDAAKAVAAALNGSAKKWVTQ